MKRRKWDRCELLLVLAFYATRELEAIRQLKKADLGILIRRMPSRSPGSLQMRISNYMARDPRMALLGVAGLYGGGSHVDAVWEEFFIDGDFDHKALLRAIVDE
jgi:hypothetical protein